MANEDKDKVIKDAQYRKGLSIAFFNATNAAISLFGNNLRPGESPDELLKQICFVRDFFLAEHKTYYAAVIANVGNNYKPKDSIEKLEKAKTLEDLQLAWRMLSADERQDKEVIKVAQKLRDSYKK